MISPQNPYSQNPPSYGQPQFGASPQFGPPPQYGALGGPSQGGGNKKLLQIVGGVVIALVAVFGLLVWIGSSDSETNAKATSTSPSAEAAAPSTSDKSNQSQSIVLTGDPTSITDAQGKLNPCTADAELRKNWNIGSFEDTGIEDDNVINLCQSTAGNIPVVMGTLKQPPATYGKGDRRQGVGTV